MSSGAARSFRHDIAIVGGGPVGATLALLLARSARTSHLSVLLAERAPPAAAASAPKMADWLHHPRTSSVNLQSEKLLRAVGVWQDLEASCPSAMHPFSSIDVWDTTGHGHLHIDAASHGSQHLGHIVSNEALLYHMYRRIYGEQSIRVVSADATMLEDLQAYHGLRPAMTQPAGAAALPFGLLVGADGFQSSIRLAMGAGSFLYEYGQRAIVANVQLADSRSGSSAIQRFLQRTGEDGSLSDEIIAVLPLADGHANIVWSVSSDKTLPSASAADILMAMPEADFLSRLSAAFDGCAPSTGQFAGGQAATPAFSRLVSPRLSFPLRLFNSVSYAGSHCALVGDAAHAVHPLAGQGLNMGLGDVASLVRAVADGLEGGEALGSAISLLQYSRERQLANALVGASVEGARMGFFVAARSPSSLSGLDSGRSALDIASSFVDGTRNAVLNTISRFPTLQRPFVRIAQGEDPRLADMNLRTL